MAAYPSTTMRNSGRGRWSLALKGAGLVIVLYVGGLALLLGANTPLGTPLRQMLQSLFATNTVQAWWYVTRAAGLTAYFLLWLSMVWGMAISTRFFHPAVDGSYSYDFHEYLSLLGLGFVLLHVVVLLFDPFLPFSIWQILVPFTDTYRPLWVGLGIIALYLFILVTVTFYLRASIGARAFRSIHFLSLVGYLGATLHGLFGGSDSALPVTRVLYVGSFLVVVFLTAYWLAAALFNRYDNARQAQRLAAGRRRQGFRRR
jgi:predicted ferric reductase